MDFGGASTRVLVRGRPKLVFVVADGGGGGGDVNGDGGTGSVVDLGFPC